LVLQRSIRTLRAGTFGRSAWDLTLPALPPPIQPSSTSLSFGSETQGNTSNVQTVTLSNTRRTAQTLGSIAAAGNFAETNNCGPSLSPGASCTVSVTFTPTGPDGRSGSLTYTGGGAQQAIALTGTGTITATLSSSAGSVILEQPVTLTWSSSSGASCTGSGGQAGANWNGPLPASGTLTVTENVASTLTYVLTCTSGAQTATAQTSVSVSSSMTGSSSSSGGGGGGGFLDGVTLAALLLILGGRLRESSIYPNGLR